jgi:hypothetical protein
MEENQVEEKKGWSWFGFFFAPFYYAGYGELKKGIIYGIISFIPFIGGLAVAIIGGRNARKDLPIGKQDFKWSAVGIVFAIFLPLTIGVQLLLDNLSSGTPKCSASKTKKLVIQIAKEEFTKQGMSKIIPKLDFAVTNIRTTNHNDSVDSYQCAADFKMIGKKTSTLPITYTVEVTDNRESFYVSVFGF